MNKINLLDSIINYLETSDVPLIDGCELDILKAHSNELKIGLGIMEEDETYSGKDILWNNINEKN